MINEHLLFIYIKLFNKILKFKIVLKIIIIHVNEGKEKN